MESRILILLMEVVVAMVGTITFGKYKHNTLRYFLLYLWGIVLLEVVGNFMQGQLEVSNLWLYNTFIILEFPLLVLWYRSFITSVQIKRILLSLTGGFLVFAGINTWVMQSFWVVFQSFNFIAGATSLIIAIILYFNEVLHTDKILIIQRGLLFWVSVGFLFFYASVIPIMITGNMLHHDGVVYNSFMLILNIILHICFLIGLLWGKKKFN